MHVFNFAYMYDAMTPMGILSCTELNVCIIICIIKALYCWDFNKRTLLLVFVYTAPNEALILAEPEESMYL